MQILLLFKRLLFFHIVRFISYDIFPQRIWKTDFELNATDVIKESYDLQRGKKQTIKNGICLICLSFWHGSNEYRGKRFTWMIEAVPGRALRGRGTPAVLGGVIGGIIGLDAGTLELARVLRLHAAGILGLFPLLAPAPRPATLQGREEGVSALRDRHRAVPMVPMMDDTGLARSITSPRRRAVRDLAIPELRGAFRELTAPVQVQSGSLLGACVTCKPKD